MDYCLWTSSCIVLHSKKSTSLTEDHICCFTCKEKSKCSFACIDRNKGKECLFQRTAEEITETWAPKTFNLVDTPKTSRRKKVEESSEDILRARKEAEKTARQLDQQSIRKTTPEVTSAPKRRQPVKRSLAEEGGKPAIKKAAEKREPPKPARKPKPEKIKSLWEVPKHIPTTVKELAKQTGATYARANYLIRTKKLSFEEALKILQN